MSSYQYIDSDAALAQACAEWAKEPFVAIDSEFIRRDTFYPIAGLLQVGAAGECALIDPLPIVDWSPLIALLRSDSVVKVIHSCSEDLEVFLRLLNCVPRPLLDTQIGAAMAGWGFGLSYQNLVLHGLGIHVDKGETRSDWLQRPLTPSQCDYAALDVLYLQRIYTKLSAELEALGRLVWWQQDCDTLLDQAEQPAALSMYFTRVKGAHKLRAREQAKLQALCEWREVQARARDIPRGRILKDPLCLDIVRRDPEDIAALSRIRNISPGTVRRHGEQILTTLSECHHARPQGSIVAPLNAAQNTLFKRFRNVAEGLASELAVPVEILARKRDLEEWVRRGSISADAVAWREALLAPHLQANLTKADQMENEP